MRARTTQELATSHSLAKDGACALLERYCAMCGDTSTTELKRRAEKLLERVCAGSADESDSLTDDLDELEQTQVSVVCTCCARRFWKRVLAVVLRACKSRRLPRGLFRFVACFTLLHDAQVAAKAHRRIGYLVDGVRCANAGDCKDRVARLNALVFLHSVLEFYPPRQLKDVCRQMVQGAKVLAERRVRDISPQVRTAAVRVLAALKAESADSAWCGNVIEFALKNDTESVRIAILEVVPVVPRVIDWVVERTRDQAPDVRSAAFRALRRFPFGELSAQQVACAALGLADRDPSVARVAAELLPAWADDPVVAGDTVKLVEVVAFSEVCAATVVRALISAGLAPDPRRYRLASLPPPLGVGLLMLLREYNLKCRLGVAIGLDPDIVPRLISAHEGHPQALKHIVLLCAECDAFGEDSCAAVAHLLACRVLPPDCRAACLACLRVGCPSLSHYFQFCIEKVINEIHEPTPTADDVNTDAPCGDVDCGECVFGDEHQSPQPRLAAAAAAATSARERLLSVERLAVAVQRADRERNVAAVAALHGQLEEATRDLQALQCKHSRVRELRALLTLRSLLEEVPLGAGGGEAALQEIDIFVARTLSPLLLCDDQFTLLPAAACFCLQCLHKGPEAVQANLSFFEGLLDHGDPAVQLLALQAVFDFALRCGCGCPFLEQSADKPPALCSSMRDCGVGASPVDRRLSAPLLLRLLAFVDLDEADDRAAVAATGICKLLANGAVDDPLALAKAR
eukprot:TRINITY_DN3019_c0_g1_i4.p1 TRINITY_DN3019_c0_g1~~TRINITY_DN3019_c0_g1_i4.p1  ORF type:complete len:745 (-),score=178.70 TRINITY_DN3019_c0_g1_i4:51-2285(-)